MSLKDPRTASIEDSIWRDLPEDRFRQNLVRLEEKTNAVPIDPETFDIHTWSPPHSSPNHTFPIKVEQHLADDFARLVAVDEGAQSVAAVCLEEHLDPPTLTLRFAALDISLGSSVHTAIRKISDILIEVASQEEIDDLVLVDRLSQIVTQLHFFRLLARLRSVKWEKPKYLSKSHKKPLWQDFKNLLHRSQLTYTKREKYLREQVETSLTAMASVYQKFEEVPPADEVSSLRSLVNASFAFCNKDEIKDFTTRLESSVGTAPTPQVGSAIKCLRQIQKIAGYRRMSFSFVEAARKYPLIFQHGLTIEYLTPYASIPTAIGYESWATSCHVHAEIQLAVHYDTASRELSSHEYLQPRCIGISKWLCFLCYRFLLSHGSWLPSKTHGRLYDQWTVPDLVEFRPETSQKYRNILKQVDDQIVMQTEEEPGFHRIEPMTSVDRP